MRVVEGSCCRCEDLEGVVERREELCVVEGRRRIVRCRGDEMYCCRGIVRGDISL